MKVVKLTTPWNHNFYAQTPGGRGIAHGCKFEIDNDCSECDHWVVWGGLRREEGVICPPENVYYLTDESHSERKFNQRFLNQFPQVIACRTDLQHPTIIKTHDLGVWHFNKSYDEVVTLSQPQKIKDLSVVASDLTWLEGHKKRFAFVNKMIGHFKDKLDVYGRGFNSIEDKYKGIAPYKYSIAIENSSIPDYFTEKLFECYLTYTMPIYYGCPNIKEYFDERSLLIIDVDDYKGCIRKIEEAVEGDLFEKSLPFIKAAREKYLQEYHVFIALTNILKNYSHHSGSTAGRKEKITLYPEQVIEDMHSARTKPAVSSQQKSVLRRVIHRITKKIR